MELILGAVVSILVQGIKKVLGTSEYVTLATVLALSILGAVVYSTLEFLGFWDTFMQVLMTAGAFYTFILRRIE